MPSTVYGVVVYAVCLLRSPLKESSQRTSQKQFCLHGLWRLDHQPLIVHIFTGVVQCLKVLEACGEGIQRSQLYSLRIINYVP
jgi:hypothetical protein